MITKPTKINRYKTDPGQWFYNFPEDIDVSKLKIHRYHQGERMDSGKVVQLDMFDSVQYLYTSYNATDKKMQKPFIACMGYIDRMNKQVFFVATTHQPI